MSASLVLAEGFDGRFAGDRLEVAADVAVRDLGDFA